MPPIRAPMLSALGRGPIGLTGQVQRYRRESAPVHRLLIAAEGATTKVRSTLLLQHLGGQATCWTRAYNGVN